MCRLALAIILLIGVVPVMTGQDDPSQKPPIIRLILPPGLPSEDVQIRYFMTGPFGGYGSFVKSEKGRRTYEIVASLDGKPAGNVKVIAYLPGCEFETLEMQIQDTTPSRALSCKPLGRITLRGQISPAAITRKQPSEVQVDYLAVWADNFFGDGDGLVPDIHLATVVPDARGHFNVEIPDFHRQANLGEGELQFTLKKTKTGNLIAFLRPIGGNRDTNLTVRASYAPGIQLLADRIR